MSEEAAAERDRVLGVIDRDLYVPGLNFVFGEADMVAGFAETPAARQELIESVVAPVTTELDQDAERVIRVARGPVEDVREQVLVAHVQGHRPRGVAGDRERRDPVRERHGGVALDDPLDAPRPTGDDAGVEHARAAERLRPPRMVRDVVPVREEHEPRAAQVADPLRERGGEPRRVHEDVVESLAHAVAGPAAAPAKPAAAEKAKEPAAKLAPGQKVNLNTASKEDLEKLPEIGPVKAQAIIDARPYKKAEDVMKVKGIKQGIFNKIKDSIVVQ